MKRQFIFLLFAVIDPHDTQLTYFCLGLLA
jgi:hypothetical protein